MAKSPTETIIVPSIKTLQSSVKVLQAKETQKIDNFFNSEHIKKIIVELDQSIEEVKYISAFELTNLADPKEKRAFYSLKVALLDQVVGLLQAKAFFINILQEKTGDKDLQVIFIAICNTLMLQVNMLCASINRILEVNQRYVGTVNPSPYFEEIADLKTQQEQYISTLENSSISAICHEVQRGVSTRIENIRDTFVNYAVSQGLSDKTQLKTIMVDSPYLKQQIAKLLDGFKLPPGIALDDSPEVISKFKEAVNEKLLSLVPAESYTQVITRILADPTLDKAIRTFVLSFAYLFLEDSKRPTRLH